MPGTYTGAGNTTLDLGGTDIVLKSDGGARSTVIDCEETSGTIGFYFHSYESPACVVDGFTIMNGRANVGGGMSFIHSYPTVRNCVFSDNSTESFGGGAFFTMCYPTLVDCEFTGNSSAQGGAVGCELHSAPTLTGCTFTDNTAEWNGGGVYCDGASPTLTGCTFTGNSVLAQFNDGGGFMCRQSTATLTDCTFSGNSAPAYGGGMMCSYESTPTLTNCTFTGNSSNYGAGLTCYEYSHAVLIGCVFSGNTAVYEGGGVYFDYESFPTLTSCTLSDNSAGDSGGGLYVYDSSGADLTGCTLSGNSAAEGGGLSCYDSSATLANSIIAFSTLGEAVYCDGGTATLSCCDVYGNAGGDWVGCLAGQDLINDNFSADPLFCNAPAGDFTIDAISPCAADNNPACGLVGAWDIGCDTPVAATSWGALKAMFR